MTFFKRAFYGDPAYNPFERPSMPLASLALDGVLGSGQNNDSGESVDTETGLGAIPTAYRCIRILSTVVASLTLEEIQKNGDSQRWTVLDNLATYTSYEILRTLTTRLAGWGNFYARKTVVNGRLVDLTPYKNEDVRVIRKRGVKTFRILNRDDDGNLVKAADGKPSYTDIPDEPGGPVFHVPGFGFDGLQGVPPVLVASQTFGTALAADRLAARFYSRGQQLGGIVKVKVPLAKQSQADAIKMAWRNSHGGVANAGDVAVMDSETEFQPITIAPEALQFLQSRQWQATEVARMFGVPPHLIGELEKSTSWGAGIEQQNIGFVAYTIRDYTDPIEQRFTREFSPRGRLLEFDLDRLLRGSTVERFQAYGQAIGWGWMTRNEARLKERMKALPGLDEPLMPSAMNGALADGPLNSPPNPNGKPSEAPEQEDGNDSDD
jgi:HK97 family phage portal protein